MFKNSIKFNFVSLLFCLLVFLTCNSMDKPLNSIPIEEELLKTVVGDLLLNQAEQPSIYNKIYNMLKEIKKINTNNSEILNKTIDLIYDDLVSIEYAEEDFDNR